MTNALLSFAFLALAGPLFPLQEAPTPPRPLSLRATFIGNEAWHITDGEYTVLTDFPYESGYSGYMTWDASMVPKISDPAKLLIVTTHEHRDHFSAGLIASMKAGGVIGPAAVGKAGIPPSGDARFGPIRVQSIATPHAGIEHYSHVIDWKGILIYLPGDTEEAKSLLEARNLDVAFVTPWMLRAVERQGAKIDARRVIVVHHEAGEAVKAYQGSLVPRQGVVLTLESWAKKIFTGPDRATR
jgi:L-ascorbate metabolism protein UlaG (beta-lactamase superfamily)